MRKNVKEEYSRFRREADRIYPHLDEQERDDLAMHNALTHVGFHKRAIPLPKLTLHTWLQIITLLLTLIFLLIFVFRAHAEPEPTNVAYDQALRGLILRSHIFAQTITPPTLFKFDASSNLDVNCITGCSAAASFADNAAFTAGTTAISITGGWFSNSPTACTSGSACAPSLTSDRKLFVQAFQGTSPWVVSANGGSFAVTGTFFQATQPVSCASAATCPVNASQVGGPWTLNLTQVASTSLGATAIVNYGSTPAAVAVPAVNSFITNTVPVTLTSTTITGTVAVTESGTWTNRIVGNAGAAFDSAQATAAPANNLAVGCTFNNQTGTTSALTAGNLSSIQCDSHGLALIDLQSEAGTAITNTPTAIGTKGSGNVLSVNSDTTSIAGTATVTAAAGVQKVGIVGNANAVMDAATNGAIPTNQLWTVNATTTAAGAAITTATTKTATTTAVVGKASAGNLYGFSAQNGAAASNCFLQLINASTSPTLGTNAVFSVALEEFTATQMGSSAMIMFPYPIPFSTGISVGFSTAYNGSTACGTGGNVTLFYN